MYGTEPPKGTTNGSSGKDSVYIYTKTYLYVYIYVYVQVCIDMYTYTYACIYPYTDYDPTVFEWQRNLG